MKIKKSRGFTLVEMAVVLVIAGLILGVIFGVATTQIKQARLSTTKQKQEGIRQALISYIIRNNRLPCPAVPNLARGAVGYGIEAATPGCVGVITSGAGPDLVYTGLIPWSTIGVTEENASDGYYNRFTYQVSASATSRTAETIAGLTGNISLHYGSPTDLGPPGTGNQSNECTLAGTTTNPCAAVVIVVSHGANGFGAYNSNGELLSNPAGADEIENANDDSKFVSKEFSEDPDNPYDDLLLSLTPSDLITPLITHGTLQDTRASVSEDFNSIKGTVVSHAIDKRVGALPTLRQYPLPTSAELANLLSTTAKTDPWGNPYQYSIGISPIRLTTDADEIAFTLTSFGPDGVLGGNDDSPITFKVSDLQGYFLNVGW